MTHDIYQFTLFKQYPVMHGISTRGYGSMKSNGKMQWDNASIFVTELGFSPSLLVLGEQVHGSEIGVIEKSIKHLIPGVDGLLTQQPKISLGVVTADCVPLLFYDRKTKTAAAVHAGYKGILAGIIDNVLSLYKAYGSAVDDILVGIGPAIGPCCYDVPKQRAALFEKFLPSAVIYEKRNGTYFLRLQAIVKALLVKAGVAQGHIEILSLCTKDNLETFYSYRGEGKDTYGEFVSVIGLL